MSKAITRVGLGLWIAFIGCSAAVMLVGVVAGYVYLAGYVLFGWR